jgi:NADH-quinone oxidoreductase subunit L
MVCLRTYFFGIIPDGIVHGPVCYQDFHGRRISDQESYRNGTPKERAPIALLSLASLWFVISLNPFGSRTWLFAAHGTHSYGLTIFSIVWIGVAVFTGWFLYIRNTPIKSHVLHEAFYLDKLYAVTFVSPILAVSSFAERIDKKYIDRFLHGLAYAQVTVAHLAGWWDSVIVDGIANGVASLTRVVGSIARSFQDGKIQLYVFWAVLAIIIFLIWSIL